MRKIVNKRPFQGRVASFVCQESPLLSCGFSSFQFGLLLSRLNGMTSITRRQYAPEGRSEECRPTVTYSWRHSTGSFSKATWQRVCSCALRAGATNSVAWFRNVPCTKLLWKDKCTRHLELVFLWSGESYNKHVWFQREFCQIHS